MSINRSGKAPDIALSIAQFLRPPLLLAEKMTFTDKWVYCRRAWQMDAPLQAEAMAA